MFRLISIHQLSFLQKRCSVTRDFFVTVQNKLIDAVSGHTTAEIIAERSGGEKINMGLTNWVIQMAKSF